MTNKDKKAILIYIAKKRGENDLKRRQLKKDRRREKHEAYLLLKQELNGNIKYENLVDKWLPPNLSYLIFEPKSPFFAEKLAKIKLNNKGIFQVPRNFSIVEHPNEAYVFLQELTAALLFQKYSHIKIDYSRCKTADLGAQVLLDIIIKDIIIFYRKCQGHPHTAPKVKGIQGINVLNEDVKKLLFSVGSPSIHSNKSINFDDIIPYSLCVHDRESNRIPSEIIKQKDIDTTKLADYVVECLRRFNKKLTPEKREDLCTVIGEALINAEEHSTTQYRYSIGYFHEIKEHGQHYGLFRLVILNFGKTIYEKFKDPNCPNKSVVEKMKLLSQSYKNNKFFFSRQFEEETLWTLYALQEGVTSVAPEDYKKRGNGCIQFIDSFFNIKGERSQKDNISRLSLLSGNTNIIFDGTYNIKEKTIDGDKFKFMTFNNSGNIEEKPDSKYVSYVANYFPGTMISAKILFNEDDLEDENRK